MTTTETRINAYSMTRKAIESGAIIKSEYCEVCGCTDRIECHHPDYLNPLNVRWLCKPCHVKIPSVRHEREFKPKVEYLTIEEVAKNLKVDHKTIRRSIKAGKIKAFQVGNRWRIPADQFEATK